MTQPGTLDALAAHGPGSSELAKIIEKTREQSRSLCRRHPIYPDL